MKKYWLGLALLALIVLPAPAFAGRAEGTSSAPGITNTTPAQDAYAMIVRAFFAALQACEDAANDVCKTEERYANIPVGGSTAMVAADQLYKSGPGYVRSITCYSDAAATAGTIALLDSTAAGTGNVLYSLDVLVADYSKPINIDLQTPFAVGLYLDFTTTADVKCMVRYR